MGKQLLGRPVAEAIKEGLRPAIRTLDAAGICPCLCIVRVGEQGSAIAYERSAKKSCEALGIRVESRTAPAESRTEELLDLMDAINADSAIHGCLLLRPLPKQVDEVAVCERLAPEKDVDGITSRSLAKVFCGAGAGFAPCTAQACLEMLDYYGVALSGANVTVIGRSLVVGRPVAALLTGRDATVTLCHRKTKDLPELCRNAEVLIAAAGSLGMVDGRYAHAGQIVLDVGTNVDASGKLRGDVDFEAVEPVVEAISPVPGGVGSVTTAVLAKHVIEAAMRQLDEI